MISWCWTASPGMAPSEASVTDDVLQLLWIVRPGVGATPANGFRPVTSSSSSFGGTSRYLVVLSDELQSSYSGLHRSVRPSAVLVHRNSSGQLLPSPSLVLRSQPHPLEVAILATFGGFGLAPVSVHSTSASLAAWRSSSYSNV